jgi:hypothetical protein
MADLNSLIAQGVQFRAPPDPFAQYAQMQQLQQGEQANQMNQALMQEKQRGFQEMNALRGVMSRPGFDLSTPESQREVYSVAPTLAEKLISGHMGTQKTAAEVRNLGFTGQETQAKLAIEKQKHLGQMYRDISSRPSDANITAHAEDVEASPLYTPEEKATVRAKAERLLAMPMADRMTMLSEQGATAGELRPQTVAAGGSLMRGGTVVGTAPEKTPPPPAMVGEYNFAKTPEGGGFRGTYQDFVTARAAAGRAPPMPRPEQPPVAVVDPVTGKPVFVSRETAISGKMSPASAQESLPPKEIQKREAALPQATSAVTGFEKKADSFVKDLTALRDHPGLSEITGIAAGRLPGITAAGRAAQALYDKVVAKGGFQALQDLRDASKTGGALGNVSNQEGKQLTASFSAIDRRQNAADVKAAIEQAIGDVQGTKTRMREAYDSTYAYKTPAAAAGQNALSPAEQTELDQLRKRFGGK